MKTSLKTILLPLLLALLFCSCAAQPRYNKRVAVTVKPDSTKLTTNIETSRKRADKVGKSLATAKAAIDRAVTTSKQIESTGAAPNSPETRLLRIDLATVQTEVTDSEKEMTELREAIVQMGQQIAALNVQIDATEKEKQTILDERNEMKKQIDTMADERAKDKATIASQRGWLWKIGAFMGGLALLAVAWVALKFFRPTLPFT